MGVGSGKIDKTVLIVCKSVPANQADWHIKYPQIKGTLFTNFSTVTQWFPIFMELGTRNLRSLKYSALKILLFIVHRTCTALQVFLKCTWL